MLAVRKILTLASGKTTVPMSRPSATRPGGLKKDFWSPKIFSLINSFFAISEANFPINSDRIKSVMSLLPEKTFSSVKLISNPSINSNI